MRRGEDDRWRFPACVGSRSADGEYTDHDIYDCIAGPKVATVKRTRCRVAGNTLFTRGDTVVPELRTIAVSLALLLLTSTIEVSAGPKAAIFPLELNDVSLEGELGGRRPAEAERLALVTRELRELASRDGGYELVDLSGLAAEIEAAAPLHRCGGCEVDIARRAGADIAVTATVRKVSNLILGFTIQVRDVTSGRLTRVVQADIRGNTDESWLRGIRWLVANRLLAPHAPQ